MLIFTYRYIVSTIVALFAFTSVLLLFPHHHSAWYVYMIPCVLTYFILVNYFNRIKLCEEGFFIKTLYKNYYFKYDDIQKLSTFKDSFFYMKTVGIRIHLKNGIYKEYNIGTLPVSQQLELNNLLKK
jgi:hypothetical protein